MKKIKFKKKKAFTYIEIIVSVTILAILVPSVFSAMTAIHRESVMARSFAKFNYYITDISEKISDDSKNIDINIMDLCNTNSQMYKNYNTEFNKEGLKFEITNIIQTNIKYDKNTNTNTLYNVFIKVTDESTGATVESNFLIKEGAFLEN